MKLKITMSIGACFILALTGNAQTNIPGIYSTGVDDSGSLLSAGQPDPHWTISSSPAGAVPALVTASLNRQWTPNTSASEWINATGLGDGTEPAGLYIYTLTFSLNGFEPSTAQITGAWASDNQSEFFLNGINTGLTNGAEGFASLAPFSITSGFVPGENELQIYVTQAPPTAGKEDPEGLQVNILSASAVAVSAPAMLSLSVVGETNLQLQFGEAVPGANYVLQYTTNLAPPISWLPLVTNAADSNGNWTFTDTNIATFPALFFRVMVP